MAHGHFAMHGGSALRLLVCVTAKESSATSFTSLCRLLLCCLLWMCCPVWHVRPWWICDHGPVSLFVSRSLLPCPARVSTSLCHPCAGLCSPRYSQQACSCLLLFALLTCSITGLLRLPDKKRCSITGLLRLPDEKRGCTVCLDSSSRTEAI